MYTLRINANNHYILLLFIYLFMNRSVGTEGINPIYTYNYIYIHITYHVYVKQKINKNRRQNEK